MLDVFLTVATLVLLELGWLLAFRLREEYERSKHKTPAPEDYPGGYDGRSN